MEETKDIINLETIPKGATMSIEVTTDLYIRLQQLMLEGLPYKDLTHFQLCLKEAHSGSITDQLSYHLITILHLCSLIEVSAKAQGVLQNKKYDPTLKTIVD